MSKLVLANEATAAQRRVYFHLVDATDGITAETGEAGGQPQISTNGGAWTNTGIGTLTAIGNGRYYADLTQATVATAGDWIETRYKSANTAEAPGDSVHVVAFDPHNAADLGLTNLTGHTPQTGDSYARLGAPAGASIAADIATVDTVVDGIKVNTDMIGTNGDGLTSIPWNATWDAEVQSEVNDALIAQGLDHLLNAAVSGVDITDNSIVARLVSKSATADWDSYDNTTDSLEAIRDRGDSAWITATGFSTLTAADVNAEADTALTDFFTSPATLVDLVWDEVITGAAHNVNSSAAKFLREAGGGIGLTGTVQSATAGTVVLESDAFPAGADDTFFRGERVSIIAGTGRGQSRLISGGTASTDTITVNHDWDLPIPDNTSTYSITGAEVDVRQFAEDGTAVINLKADYDGTGYNKSNSTMGTVTTLTGHTAQTGDSFARLGAPAGASIAADIATIDTNADTLLTRLTSTRAGYLDNLSAGAVATAAALATVDTVVDSILDDTGNSGVVVASGSKSGYSLSSAGISSILTTQMTESYNTDGTAPTLAQALFVTMQRLTDFAISSTTVTVKQLDGSTTAYTLTLDDASTPTSSTRAT